METVTIQVQSVLYQNEKESLMKALRALDNAKKIANKRNIVNVELTVCYGDASPEAIFTDSEVAEINNNLSGIKEFKYSYWGFNSGSAKGHNILGETCTSEYMMIQNPDVIVSPQFFCVILNGFEDKKVGMVEARQTPIEHPKEYDVKTKETDWATTACALFPTEIFRKLNGFDADSFFMYCDDLDFSWRLRLEGYKILYQPLAPVYHAKRLSSDAKWQPTAAEKYYSAEAAILMAYKFSNDRLVKQILRGFNHSGDTQLEKAAKAFETRKETGNLPKQIDPEHKVAKFIGNLYTEHRFEL